MRKLLLTSSVLALLSAPAFAAGNLNLSSVSQFGFGNGAGVAQSGLLNHNTQTTIQKGVLNTAITAQGGAFNRNSSGTFQFGFGNASVVTQQ